MGQGTEADERVRSPALLELLVQSSERKAKCLRRFSFPFLSPFPFAPFSLSLSLFSVSFSRAINIFCLHAGNAAMQSHDVKRRGPMSSSRSQFHFPLVFRLLIQSISSDRHVVCLSVQIHHHRGHGSGQVLSATAIH